MYRTTGDWAVFRWLLLPIALTAAISRAADQWPQFRGPDASGVVSGTNLPVRWTATENVEWKTDIPGRGWSSPIVWGDRIFLTTSINQGETEKPKKGIYIGGERPEPPQTEHQWKVYCLSLPDGRVVWEKLAYKGVPLEARHLKNSYASETPVTDGKRVYVYFGNLGIFCYDFNGRLLWSKLLPPHKTLYAWGTGASPVLYKDHLYIVNDNEEDSYLLALDTRSGDEVWRVARDEKSNWATPYIWRHDGRAEIVTPGQHRIRSYDLDGKLLWELAGLSNAVIATPYVNAGLLYVSSGFTWDPNRPVFAIRPGASGDITLGDKETSNAFVAWCNKKAGPYNPTTIVSGDRLYVLLDQGFLACYDARSGKQVYGKKRLPAGRAFTASPWAFQDKIFCLNEDGVTFVVKAGDGFELLHTNKLAADDMCMATPAISGDRLLIRSSERIYCIRNSAQGSSEAASK